MRCIVSFVLGSILVGTSCASPAQKSEMPIPNSTSQGAMSHAWPASPDYAKSPLPVAPSAKVDVVCEQVHGTQLCDRFRWMEDERDGLLDFLTRNAEHA